MIPHEKWKWYGNAAHFCGGRSCLFHLATQIGKHLISTVGDYRPWPDQRDKPEELGCDRFYETMVFEAGAPCQEKGCECGLPTTSGRNLDFEGYKTAGEATRGHLGMCEKWAKKEEN